MRKTVAVGIIKRVTRFDSNPVLSLVPFTLPDRVCVLSPFSLPVTYLECHLLSFL
jgi:hypothetical protein